MILPTLAFPWTRGSLLLPLTPPVCVKHSWDYLFLTFDSEFHLSFEMVLHFFCAGVEYQLIEQGIQLYKNELFSVTTMHINGG
jgi:hypothetical protein